MPFYLIETRDLGNRITPVLVDSEADLVSELSEMIRDAHYNGLGLLVEYIGRWAGHGEFTPMFLTFVREVPELDGQLDLYYELRDARLDVERSFVVTIYP